MSRYNAEQFNLFPLAVTLPRELRPDSHVKMFHMEQATIAHGLRVMKESRREERNEGRAAAKVACKSAKAAAREVLAALAGETVADRVHRQWEASMRKSTVVPVEVEENERQRWASWSEKQAGKSAGSTALLAFDEITTMTRSAMLLSEKPSTVQVAA